MKSISFYIVSIFIRLKGVKSIFSRTRLDYLKLRKSDIKFPDKNLLLNQEVQISKVHKSILTEIIPKNAKSEGTIILYCPGGAFVYGPTDINWKSIAIIAKKTKLITFVVDYPKAPEVTIEEINTNINDVYNHLTAQQTTKNIVLIGDSVGGTLLILLVQRLLKSKSALIAKSIILISPVADCSMTNPKIPTIDKKDIMLSIKGVLSAKQMCAGDIDLKSEIISPLYGNLKGFIDTYIFIAENDIMQPDQEILVKKLFAEDVFVKVYRGDNSPHIWPLLPYMKEAKDSLNTIISIINNLESKGRM